MRWEPPNAHVRSIDQQIPPTYLSHYFTTEEGFAKVYAASPGTAARNRTLTADSLMAITVPVPPIQIQQQFAALQSKLTSLRQAQQDEVALSEAVVPALIARTMVG
jgi:restriction endonuclease S subunit